MSVDRRFETIEYADFVAFFQKSVNRMGTDKAGTSGDQDSHNSPLVVEDNFTAIFLKTEGIFGEVI